MTPQPESPALAPGRVVAGRYRVERQIGEGGVGSVYLVRHLHTDEELALKVLQTHALRDAGAVERFRKEARAPARIGGEHVTRVTDADTAPDLDNAPFLVMELLRGRDVTAVVAERGPLPPALVLELLRQAARALDRAHSLGIVHRDLKPDNLFLTERDDGTPCIKLLDFGIARIGDAALPDGAATGHERTAVKTQAGLVFGTPGYMAPEQMTGEVDLISPATDVWAVGLVAFYMLVGEDFWDAPTLAKLYATILAEPIPLPSQRGSALGEPFDVWFGRCVQRDPAARFPTVGEAVAGLPVALGLRASAPPRSLPPLDRVERGPSRPDIRPPSASRASTLALLAAAPSPRVLLALAGAAAVLVAALVTLAWAVFVPRGDEVRATMASPGSAATSATASPIRMTATARPAATAAPDPAPLAVEAQDAGAATPLQGQAAPARPAWDPRMHAGSREQQDRLDALQRLCDQGTVTAAECAAKRGAILRGEP